MLICGVDEAGRGPLAGSVFAAAVILPDSFNISGLDDSKKLTAKQREHLYKQIIDQSLAWHIASATVDEIDDINILQATMLAMQRAVAGLAIKPDQILIDGNRVPKLECPAQAIVGGDGKVPAISAASILAKIAKDSEAEALEQRYPGYGFARHKGYGTALHLDALNRLGPCPAHRKSFAPVRLLLSQSELF